MNNQTAYIQNKAAGSLSGTILRKSGLFLSAIIAVLVITHCSGEPTAYNSVYIRSGTYIEIPNSSSLQRINQDQLTLEIWAAGRSGTDTTVQCMAMISDDQGGDEIGIYRGKGDSLIYCFVDNQNLPPVYIDGFDIDEHKIHYYCLVVDIPKASLYFDGQLVAQSTISSMDIDIGVSNMLIGADYDCPASCIDNFWQGYFDEVRLWDKAFSSDDVTFHHKNPGKLTEHYSSTGLQNLIGVWRFNTQGSSVIHDGSGNGNHGVIRGDISDISWHRFGVD